VPRIRTLRPYIAREEALRDFSRGRIAGVRSAVFGQVQQVVDFYIPYRFFQMTGGANRQPRGSILGVDAVTGKLDLYQFESLPGPDDIDYVETRNCVPPLLDETSARELLRQKSRRTSGTELPAEAIPGDIYIPYWVGFRGPGMGSRFSVIDAMRGQIEGRKVRNLLREWLVSITVKS